MMTWSIWWKLPGPARFLRALTREIEDGKSVILRWPHRPPRNWRFALEETNPGLLSQYLWTPFSAHKTQGLSPQEFLANSTGLDLGPSWEITPERLLEAPDKIESRIFVLEDLDAQTWRAWQPFLTTYADLSRNIDTESRARFLVSLKPGEPIPHLSTTDVCLTSLTWDGYISSLDTQIFADHFWHDSLCTSRQKPLWLAMVTAFAAWDPEAIQTLATMKLASLCDLQLLSERLTELLNRATPQIETSTTATRDHRWLTGLIQSFDGRDTPHPACLLHKDEEVTHLLWTAQMTILLPLIERERRRFQQKFAPSFQIPFTTNTGERIDQLQDMEIGHIWHQMTQNPGRYPQDDRDRVRLLRHARNELAHFKPLDFNTIYHCLA